MTWSQLVDKPQAAPYAAAAGEILIHVAAAPRDFPADSIPCEQQLMQLPGLRLHSTEQTKDQCKHNGENNRRYDRKIDADVPVRTFVFDVAWQKRKSRRDIGLLSGRAAVREPANKSKSQEHDDEDLEKGTHDDVDALVRRPDRS